MLSEHDNLLFHTEIRWLSKGKVQERFWELIDEIVIFLRAKDKKGWINKIQSSSFSQHLAYLTDIFSKLNSLNLQLQGQNKNVFYHFDQLSAFKQKLILWNSRTDKNNICTFENLESSVSKDDWKDGVKESVKNHLKSLIEKFVLYLPQMKTFLNDKSFIVQPFSTDVTTCLLYTSPSPRD